MRVAALIILDEGLVLVRHRSGDSTYNLLPGGGVDYRETLEDAIKREVKEETGLTIEVGRPLFINDTIDPEGTRHVINITFAATAVGGRVTEHPADRRVEAVEVINPNTLPHLDLRPPLADAILQVLADGTERCSARYLGSLFTPEARDRRAGHRSESEASPPREVSGGR